MTGEYVKGSYGYRSGDVQEIWNENIGIQNLRWVDLGVFSVLQRYGPDGQFDRDRMVALAESLTTRPVATSLTPMPTATPTPTSIPSTPEPAVQFTLSLAEASEKAGFTVQAPTYLPEKFIYKGTSYDPGTHLVGLSFDYDDSMVTVGAYGKWIREELVLPAGRCNLCPFRGGDDGKAAWADPTASIIPQDSIETVQIGAVAGQYVEGMYHNGGEWEPDPYAKRLRWQANGIAFEIFMTGNDFAKENVIAIAESMK